MHNAPSDPKLTEASVLRITLNFLKAPSVPIQVMILAGMQKDIQAQYMLLLNFTRDNPFGSTGRGGREEIFLT